MDHDEHRGRVIIMILRTYNFGLNLDMIVEVFYENDIIAIESGWKCSCPDYVFTAE